MPEQRTPADRLPFIAELAGLARALEAGGVYNGAKLVRAVLDRQLTTIGRETAPAGAVAIADAVERLADRLAGEGSPAALVAGLRAAADAARHETTLPLAAAPPVHVCRVCGELFTGDPPALCPTCEAPALSFREQLPVWYLEPMESSEIVGALEGGLRRVAEIVEARDEAQLARPPRAGEWSARETLAHLMTAEGLLAGRVRRMLAEDDPELVALAAWAVHAASDEATEATDVSTRELLSRYRALRGATIAVLQGLDATAWERTGRHPEWGRVTIRSQAGYFVRHEAAHTAQLAAAAEGRVPGEPGRPGTDRFG